MEHLHGGNFIALTPAVRRGAAGWWKWVPIEAKADDKTNSGRCTVYFNLTRFPASSACESAVYICFSHTSFVLFSLSCKTISCYRIHSMYYQSCLTLSKFYGEFSCQKFEKRERNVNCLLCPSLLLSLHAVNPLLILFLISFAMHSKSYMDRCTYLCRAGVHNTSFDESHNNPDPSPFVHAFEKFFFGRYAGHYDDRNHFVLQVVLSL